MYADIVTMLTIFITGIWSLENEIHIFEKCNIERYQKKFDVLPGRGWDNLNNEQMGQIINLNFSSCQYSQDNVYLLPDFVSLTPLKMSEIILNSNSFAHFANYTSVTSESVNVEAHASFYGVSLSGSFSKEKEQVKSDQIQTKSSIIRVQLRYKVFKSISEPDAQLHPRFRNRIMDIAALVIADKDSLYPAYLADMIVRDYGTHVTRSIDAGAVLSKVDFLSSEYTARMQSNVKGISVIASSSFGSFFGISGRYTERVQTATTEEYDRQCEKTRINTYGGILYGAKFSLDEWRLSVLDNLVPINRMADPIYYVITPKALPALDDVIVYKVYTLLKDAVKRYYTANSRIGCLDINSPNFNSDANVDSQSCESVKRVFNFGGIYQDCRGPMDQCYSMNVVNPLTGTYSCPTMYESVLLYSGQNMCKDYCESSFIFWTKCTNKCSFYDIYWCYPINVNENRHGLRFGGFISYQMKSCPLGYFPVKMGLSAQLCVSINNDPLDVYAIKFGGLYSCTAGNPLAHEYADKKNGFQSSEQRPKMCAKGYMSHHANMEQGCAIAYCSETNKVSLGPLPTLVKPPFISLYYNPNITEVSVISTAEGTQFIKTEVGNWEIDNLKKKEKNIIIGTVTGTVFIVCVLISAILYQYRTYKKKITKLQDQIQLIDAGGINNDGSSRNIELA